MDAGAIQYQVNSPIDLMEATLSEDTTSECVSELKCIDKFFQKVGSLAASLTTEIAAWLSGSHGVSDDLEI